MCTNDLYVTGLFLTSFISIFGSFSVSDLEIDPTILAQMGLKNVNFFWVYG